MVKKKNVNINQPTLFDIGFNEDTKLSSTDEDGFNTEGVSTNNIEDYTIHLYGTKEDDKYKEYFNGLIENSSLECAEKFIVKKLYNKDIISASEVMELLVKLKEEKEDKEFHIAYTKSKSYSFTDTIGESVNSYMNFSEAKIGNALGHYIKFKNINQSRLAQMANIDRTTLFNIIKKPNSVSLINAYKICKILGEDMETLFPFFLEEDTEE